MRRDRLARNAWRVTTAAGRPMTGLPGRSCSAGACFRQTSRYAERVAVHFWLLLFRDSGRRLASWGAGRLRRLGLPPHGPSHNLPASRLLAKGAGFPRPGLASVATPAGVVVA